MDALHLPATTLTGGIFGEQTGIGKSLTPKCPPPPSTLPSEQEPPASASPGLLSNHVSILSPTAFFFPAENSLLQDSPPTQQDAEGMAKWECLLSSLFCKS